MKTLLFFVCLFSATLAQPDIPRGTILASEYVITRSVATINQIIGSFYPPEQALPALYPVDEYRLTFHSEDEAGAPLAIIAQLFVPRVAQPVEFPVLVVGAGTTGLADDCAPSREQPEVHSLGNYRAFVLGFAAQGWIVILPDYAGYNDPDRVQAYYVAELAARVMTDAARAAYDAFAASHVDVRNAAMPLNRLFLGGYSQGGQAVFAAKDRWADAAPDLPLAGIVAWAPIVDMANHTLYMPPFAPYRMVVWSAYYGSDQVPLAELFADRWLPTLEADALQLCVNEAVIYFSADPETLFRPKFLQALRSGTLDRDFPALHRLLELNSPGNVPSHVPALIVQGTDDNRIPMPVHDGFLRRTCAAGNRVTTLVYEDATHAATRRISYRDVLNWMQSVINGETPPNNCP
ncbi:MAG: hypothetical protein HZC41_02700 [Chloroflexi bacterium]|nr:hypothetical protein [Chloroflexota bacterium]